MTRCYTRVKTFKGGRGEERGGGGGEGHVIAFYIKSSSSLKMKIKLRRKRKKKTKKAQIRVICAVRMRKDVEGAVRSFEEEGRRRGGDEERPPLQDQAGAFTWTSKVFTPGCAPPLLFFFPSFFGTSKTKRAFHRGGGGMGGSMERGRGG